MYGYIYQVKVYRYIYIYIYIYIWTKVDTSAKSGYICRLSLLKSNCRINKD